MRERRGERREQRAKNNEERGRERERRERGRGEKEREKERERGREREKKRKRKRNREREKRWESWTLRTFGGAVKHAQNSPAHKCMCQIGAYDSQGGGIVIVSLAQRAVALSVLAANKIRFTEEREFEGEEFEG